MCRPSDSPAIRLFSGEEKDCSKQNKFPACFFQGMICRIIVSGYLAIGAHAAFVPYSTMY